MVVVPIPQAANEAQSWPPVRRYESIDLIGFAAGVTLVAGGVLLLRGKRRAGMIAAATGTAIAMLDQQETLRSWWKTLPIYLNEAQVLLGKVQGAVDELAVKREKLRELIKR